MKNNIFIITGHQGSGKTTFLSHLIRELKGLELRFPEFYLKDIGSKILDHDLNWLI